MKNRLIRFLVLSAIGFIVGALLAFAQVREEAAAHSTSAATSTTGASVGGPFKAVNQKGAPVTEKSWPGKYKLVFFGFTHCPDTCPVTLQKMSAVMEKTDPKGEKIVPLFVTVDPARDTPKALAPYLKNFNPHIVGITGTEAQIKALEETYKVYAARQPGQNKDDYLDYMEDHSAYVYLMSPDDKLLQTFSSEDEAKAMVEKIRESVK